jgi:Tfp pilus assembly protein PilO
MLASLLLFLAAIFIYFVLVQPAYDSSETKKGQYQAERNFLDSQKDTIKSVQDLITKYQNQESTQRGIDLSLPTTMDLSGAIAQVTGMAAQSALLIDKISITSPSIPKKNTAAGDTTSTASFAAALQKPIGTIVLHIQLIGGYANVKQFISFLETNIRIFDVTAIAIAQAQQTKSGNSGNAKTVEDRFSYDITATTYYQGP